MLERLFVQNLATVEKQVIDFSPDFTVITGETGAGKSVLMKSLYLLLGGKCSKDLIRMGTEFLSVEGTFSIEQIPQVREILAELGIDNHIQLTIRRRVTLSGKNSIFINDYSSNLASLSQLGKHLIDIHGQHSQQTLSQIGTHIDYLDQFSGLMEEREEYQLFYRQLQDKKRELSELIRNRADRARKIDFIRYQLDEIENAGFTLEEEEELNEEFQLLSHGEQLIGSLSPVAEWNSSEYSPLIAISSILPSLQDVLKIDSKLEDTIGEIQGAVISLEEAATEVSRYLNSLEINPQRLDWINQRLAELERLKRKHGATLEEIFQYRDEQLRELQELENLDESQSSLDEEIRRLEGEVREKARLLSEKRHEYSTHFEKLILSNLKELGLERSRFKVDIQPLPKEEEDEQTVNNKGMDQIEFLITTNPGNPLKPLAKVASGGELSRIMLSIKTTLTHDISLGTMVFDEIDTGISGRVAESVGIKLHNLGKKRQIICITHSPQIAAKAQSHLRVEKKFKKDSSTTFINTLGHKERVTEIARFLGGNEITENALSTAEEMLVNQG